MWRVLSTRKHGTLPPFDTSYISVSNYVFGVRWYKRRTGFECWGSTTILHFHPLPIFQKCVKRFRTCRIHGLFSPYIQITTRNLVCQWLVAVSAVKKSSSVSKRNYSQSLQSLRSTCLMPSVVTPWSAVSGKACSEIFFRYGWSTRRKISIHATSNSARRGSLGKLNSTDGCVGEMISCFIKTFKPIWICDDHCDKLPENDQLFFMFLSSFLSVHLHKEKRLLYICGFYKMKRFLVLQYWTVPITLRVRRPLPIF